MAGLAGFCRGGVWLARPLSSFLSSKVYYCTVLLYRLLLLTLAGAPPSLKPSRPASASFAGGFIVTAPYIPPTSSGLDSWASNFSTLITASPALYGLTPADAVNIAASVAVYHAAYLLAGTTPPHNTPVNPTTRTPVNVAAMRTAQSALVGTLRTYASQIRINPGVANGDKVALGLNLPNTTPSPVPAPAGWPLLSLVMSGPLLHQFSYKDSLTPTGKAKPGGAVQMRLVASLLTPAPTADDMATIALPTKSPFQVTWPGGDSGKTATYYARWVTRRGLVGPWSPSTALIIP